jgi:PhoH-like ATPase
MPEIKVYVLDTNIFIHDPRAMLKFAEHWVVIPMKVIEELDALKTREHYTASTGTAARQASAEIAKLQKLGLLKNGITTDGGGKVFVDFADDNKSIIVPRELSVEKNDNFIIGVALKWQLQHSDKQVVLITKDNNMSIKADGCGLAIEDYKHDRLVTNLSELYSGIYDVDASSKLIDELQRAGRLKADRLIFQEEVRDNGCCVLRGGGKRALATYKKQAGVLRRVFFNPEPSNKGGDRCSSPINDEQALALDLLMDPEIPLVTLVGKAGTGKTLMALFAGYKQLDIYSGISVYRPIVTVGKDIGFLPGEIHHKLAPWMLPIRDNMELILGYHDEGAVKQNDYEKYDRPRSEKNRKGSNNPPPIKSDYEMLKHSDERRGASPVDGLIAARLLEIAPIAYIRGRSLHKHFIIIDEAQNLTPHEVKTIITRIAKGSKVILTGDPSQIDNPWLDAVSNGLAYVVERFKGQRLFGHITFKKGERSELSELAADLL